MATSTHPLRSSLPKYSLYIHLLILISYSFWHVQPSECAAVSSSVNLPGSPACDAKNRDPCTNFPGLCSTGGGLCVFKGPCEYECVCPPDGRRGRDCTGSGDANKQREETSEPSNSESLLNSLLVFPQDLFWDLNHVLRPEESVKMMLSTPPQNFDSGLSTTTIANTASRPTNLTEISIQNDTSSTPQTSYDKENVTISVSFSSAILLDSNQQQSLQSQARSKDGDASSFQTTTTQSSPLSAKPTTTIKSPIFLHTASSLLQNTPSPTSPSMTAQNPTDDYMIDASFTDTDNIPARRRTIPEAVDDVGVTRSSLTNDDSDQSLSATLIKLDKTGTLQPIPKITRSFTSSTAIPTLVTSSNLQSTKQRSFFLSGMENRSTVSHKTSSQPSSVTLSTPKFQKTSSTINQMNLLKTLATTTSRPVAFTKSTNLREQFPGHESFPTFFRDVVEDKTNDDGPPNMAVSKRVHRVFFPIFQFEQIKRRGRGGK